jgi:hypothetical protein
MGMVSFGCRQSEKLLVFILAIATKKQLESSGNLCLLFIDNVQLPILIFGLLMGQYFLVNVIKQWVKKRVLQVILNDLTIH